MIYQHAEIGLDLRALDDYPYWQHPLRSSRIYMHPMPMKTLSAHALRSFKAKQSSEIGGILWGKLPAENKDQSTIIMSAEFVHSEGPFYNSTPGDARKLVQALKVPKIGKNLSLVGYFRSHIREGLCLTPQDQELIEQNIRDPGSVFLIIRPFDMGICMAGFFFWQNGRLQTDGSDLEVPFISVAETRSEGNWRVGQVEAVPERRAENSLLTGLEWGSLPGNKVEEIGPQSATSSESRQPAKNIRALSGQHKEKSIDKSKSEAQDRRLYLVTVTLALLLIGAVGVAAYFALPTLRRNLQNLTEDASKTGVRLQVVRASDGQLDLTWNQRAPELENAKSAKLTITDGSLYREVNMDNAQLRSGRLTYFPVSADVQFRLEVYLDTARSLAEWVRVLSPEVNATAAGFNNATDTSTRNNQPSASANYASLETSAVEVPVHREFKVTALKAIDPISLRMSQPMSALQQWEPPPDVRLQIEQNPTALPLPLLLAPLPVPGQFTATNAAHAINYAPRRTEYAVKDSNVAHLSGSQAAVDSKPALAAQSGDAALVHPGPAKQTITAASNAVSDLSVAGLYVPPRPIRKVMPNTKFIEALVRDGPLRVEVEVSIDRLGHVTQAHTLRNDERVNNLLAGTAVAAAKQWTFEPATLRGRAVPADHTIVFQFRGGSR